MNSLSPLPWCYIFSIPFFVFCSFVVVLVVVVISAKLPIGSDRFFCQPNRVVLLSFRRCKTIKKKV